MRAQDRGSAARRRDHRKFTGRHTGDRRGPLDDLYAGLRFGNSATVQIKDGRPKV
jgi:hypothetical protein